MIEMYTEQELKEQLHTHWVNGVRVSNAHAMSASEIPTGGQSIPSSIVRKCQSLAFHEHCCADPLIVACPSDSS